MSRPTPTPTPTPTPVPGSPDVDLAGLPGIDPAWSRYVEAVDADGITRRWHVLEKPAVGGTAPAGTLLAVHGNPTWSYLWRRVLAEAPADWRVVAVDQLGMGLSEHPNGTLEHPRTLPQRLDDLDGLTEALGVHGPVVVAGHDWGGVIASGWAQRHVDELAGIVLANTAVHHDFSAGLPAALRVARDPRLLRAATVTTPAFVRATTGVSRPQPPHDVRAAYAAPYRTPAERDFVGQFVADIPLESDHPARAAFDAITEGMALLSGTPALLLRGPLDPVFSEAHLRDLRRRLPHASVHRYEGASHLVLEDAPRTATDIWDWVREVTGPAVAGSRPEVPASAVGTPTVPWQGLLDAVARDPEGRCVTEMRTGQRATFAELEADIEAVAQGLVRHGVRPGDRIAMLVPPGIDLTVAVYASWRVGGVIVVADAGLGVGNLGRILRGAGPDHVIGIPTAMAAARALRIPGQRIVAGDMPAAARRAAGVACSLDELRAPGVPVGIPPLGDDDPECAILYTSGATGPSKGVVYRVSALRTMIGHVGTIYGLGPSDVLVAAFAPFALYGPALGIGAVTPDMDVTAPGTLTAAALADAISTADATVVFASPAALRNVVRTAGDLTSAQREALARPRAVMSAGAPVPADLLREVQQVMPNAEPHTPYGMTEALPVSDITLAGIEEAGVGDGVCVGRPLPDVEVSIAPLPMDPSLPDGEPTTEPGVMGEIVVRAAHTKDRYDQLWATTRASSPAPGVHRSGDVGHLDAEGRLWVEGRRVHVVHTAQGPVTPVRLEQAAGSLPGVAQTAVVGVGPVGVQQVVVVLVLEPEAARREHRGSRLSRNAPLLAPPELAARVRELAGGLDVAAVLLAPRVPVDIRHQSKIDRTAVAAWAEKVLAGKKASL